MLSHIAAGVPLGRGRGGGARAAIQQACGWDILIMALDGPGK
jgi:hypothetical protein